MSAARSYKVEHEDIGSWRNWQEVQLLFWVVLSLLPLIPVRNKERIILNMVMVSQSLALLKWSRCCVMKQTPVFHYPHCTQVLTLQNCKEGEVVLSDFHLALMDITMWEKLYFNTEYEKGKILQAVSNDEVVSHFSLALCIHGSYYPQIYLNTSSQDLSRSDSCPIWTLCSGNLQRTCWSSQKQDMYSHCLREMVSGVFQPVWTILKPSEGLLWKA